jgi:hypothetical protein
MERSGSSHSSGRRAYLVYDAGTGRIAHTVYVDVLKGAEVPSDAEIEKQVLISAAHATGIAQETLRHLAVDPERLKRGMTYEVDPKTGNLREKRASSPRTKHPPRK